MKDASQVRKKVEAILGDSKELEFACLESGAVSIVVRSGVHAAVIDGRDGGDWGVSIDPMDDQAFTGHDQVVKSLDDALLIVRQGMCSGDRSCV